MAKYACPCCGKEFNGRKCRNCLYETFGKEVPQALHTHSHTPVSRYDTRMDTGKINRRKTLPKWMIFLLIFLLLEPILLITAGVIEGISQGLAILQEEPVSPRPEIMVTEDYRQVFSADGFTIHLAQPDEEQRYPLIFENSTDQDVCFSRGRILVDGFVSEQSFAYCDAPAHSFAEGGLYLDPEDMNYAIIGSPSQIQVEFVVYDGETYEDILLGRFTIENDCAPLILDPAGDILWDKDGLQIRSLGYVPDPYAPDVFVEGAFLVYLRNDTDTTLGVGTESVLVNGNESQLGFWCELPPGTRTVTRILLYTLEEPHPEDMVDSSLELQVNCFDLDNDGYIQLEPLTIPIWD